LSDSLESVLALLDAGSIRMGALQVEQDSLAARLGRSETRIALLDSVGLERHTAAEARMADLGLRMQAAENIQTEQGAQLRTAKKRQSILLGAVPVFLGPYIHILDHGGRR
jgi:hypothetical protein